VTKKTFLDSLKFARRASIKFNSSDHIYSILEGYILRQADAQDI